MKFLSNQHIGAIYAIISGLCYSLVGYFGITIVNGGSSVANMLFWRFIISALSALILLLPNSNTLSILSTDNLKIMLSGIVLYSTSSIGFFVASLYIGTGLAMIIFFIYPAFVMIINVIFYRAPFRKVYIVAFLIIITGLVLIVDVQDASFSIIGIVTAGIAAIFYAWYIVASEKIVVHPLLSTLMVSIGCSITCFIFSLYEGSFYIPSSVNDWLDIVIIGVLCTSMPILLLLKAMKYIDAEKASTLSVVEPVFVLIIGITLLDEKVTITQIIGTIIVLFGAILILLRNVPKNKYGI